MSWSPVESIRKPISGGKWEPVSVPHMGRPGWGTFPAAQQSLWYRRTFETPELAGRRAFLHFTRVGFQCRVWVNGKAVGAHIGAQTPFQIDISDVLRVGANKILVGANFSVYAPRGEYPNMPTEWTKPTPDTARTQESLPTSWSPATSTSVRRCATSPRS